MEVRWTSEQKRAIEAQNCNLLVSAAAGSGKTAVLVERIVKLILQKENPKTIDRFLIVTFTKAAAAGMKEKIEKRLLELNYKEPDNLRIVEQLTLLQKAQISTIHSFCMNLIRDHYNMLELDPSFRIGEEGEMALIKNDVMDQLLEQFYEEGSQEFFDLTEAFTDGKKDDSIANMIWRIYDFSMSHPKPELWLEQAKDMFAINNEAELETLPWKDTFLDYIEKISLFCREQIQYAKEILEHAGEIPIQYAAVIEADEKIINHICLIHSFSDIEKQKEELSFPRLPSVRKKEQYDLEAIEQIKQIHANIKESIEQLIDKYLQFSSKEMVDHIKCIRPYVNILIRMVLEYKEKFLEYKRKKNVYEFSDLEHFALKLLVDGYDEYGTPILSEIAKSARDYYQEIFIDEYQDSNLIQETILTAISKKEKGQENLFMVGDVKQSIYRFRMARPEIFMEKYAAYQNYEEGKEENSKVELQHNFRSNQNVLFCINYIFYQIMGNALGGIHYTKEVALKPGAKEQMREDPFHKTELYLIPMDDEVKEDKEEEESEAELGKIELEALSIAQVIHNLMNENKDLQYKDIVILLRTMEGWADTIQEILMEEGIHACADSQKGYFQTMEIQTILSLLSIVDNPYNEIPLVAVLRSPMVGLTGNDLAIIKNYIRLNENLTGQEENSEFVTNRAGEEDSCLQTASMVKEQNMFAYLEAFCTSEHEEKQNQDIIEKLQVFLERYEHWQKEKNKRTLPEFIQMVIWETGFYHYVGGMPSGEKRQENIWMLLEQARKYEKTSYRGLFYFIRYMNQLKSYEMDFGEASVIGEEENVVRIMSIHKSKGLEFPVVIMAGMGKKFNFMDANESLVLHPDLYMGFDYVNLEHRIKNASASKKILQKQLVLDTLAEELRILYVGMTRAKEKLIMTGTVANLRKELEKWKLLIGRKQEMQLDFIVLSQAKSYMDWIFAALYRNKSMKPLLKSYGIPEPMELVIDENVAIAAQEHSNESKTVQSEFQIKVVSVPLLMQSRLEEKRIEQDEHIPEHNWEEYKNDPLYEQMIENLNWTYSHKKEINVKAKWSVSELKRGEYEETSEKQETQHLIEQNEEEIDFLERINTKAGTQSAAQRGTAIHKMLELISFEKIEDEKSFQDEYDTILKGNKIDASALHKGDREQIQKFFFGSLGTDMRQAAKKNKLWKERQFVMGIPMREIEQNIQSEELVLIQGIIDAYYEMDDEIVIVDYKSDFVKPGQGDILIAKYEKQLRYYARAMEQMTGKKVKKMLIYSFALSKEIEISC